MMKGFVLIVLGLLIGLVVAMSFNQDFGSEQQRLAPVSGGSIEDVDALRAHVDQQIAAIDQRLSVLGRAVDDLSEQLAPVEMPPVEAPRALRDGDNIRQSGRTPAPIRDPSIIQRLRARQLATQQDDPDRILAAGFTQDRIDRLDRRVEELQMAARQAQPEAGGAGASVAFDPLLPIPAQAMMSMTEPHSLLRPEIGDDEYERYLQAKGRTTTVAISQVLASSPAEQGGLREGDEIVAYGGERVFSLLDLRSLAANRTSGESVLVEIKRDGQTMQLAVSGGDMGIDGCFLNCWAN
jgi:membrane-associated protease RseP (regulator of RpoE activity)